MSAPPLIPLGQLLADVRERYADRAALIDARRSFTYGELDESSARLAGALGALGASRGDRVVLAAPNRCEWVITEHALARSGLVRVALIPRLHPRELAHIAEDCEPFAIVVENEWVVTHGLDWLPRSVRHVIVIDCSPDLPGGVIDFDELLSGGDVLHELPPAPEELAALWYTSGSTGLPKGVLCTHRTFGASTRNILSVMPLRAEDVTIHTAPISHWSGAIGLATAAAGGCNVFQPGFVVEQLADQVADSGATVMPLVPTQISRLVDRLGPRGDERFDSVRLIPYAGSAIAPDRLQQALNCFPNALAQFYGSAEVPAPITYLGPEDHAAAGTGDSERLLSAGHTHPLTDVRIDSHGEANGVGEIVCRGDQVTSGYWRQADSTAEALDREGWFRTGDVGYLDESGYLFIVDRKKEMVITGGFNVYPREVENAISTLEGVAEVAVIGTPDDSWGEVITAIVAARPGTELDADAIREHCRRTIAGYKVPKLVEFLDELPKSGSGKVLKRQLREERWAGRKRQI